MSKETMSPKQKGYIGLGAMIVLSAATIWGSEPLYKAIDNFGKEPIYTAGTYTGKSKGFGGDVVASVTVSTTSIEKIELAGDGETPGIGTNAMEQMPGQIMGKGSTDIDAVSGATITSDAIKDAVDRALTLARGEAVEAEPAEPETETTALAEAETAAKTEAETTVATKKEYNFAPGTYTGEAQGYGGAVSAEVTVSATGIDSIKLIGSDETAEIGGTALKKLEKKMMEVQSGDVDAISSATITSDAAIAAVNAALTQATDGVIAGNAGEPEGAGEVNPNQFTPGTYTGEAQGYGGKVTAEITVSETSMDEVKLKGSDETDEIGGTALKKLEKKMMEAQSADIDAVSSATITSDAAIEAAKQALEQAKG